MRNPMACTPEERAEISRRNGRLSRGPTSERGKSISRMNALNHGCRAETLTMPDEPPELVAELYGEWNDHYRPRSPGARHLLELCVRAKLLSDRCFRAHDSAVAGQVEEAANAFDRDREEMVADQQGLLADDPAAVAALMSTGAGCRALLGRWGRFRRLLEAQGYWRPGACAEAVRLLGVVPELDRLKEDERAYLMMVCNLRCQPGDTCDQVALLGRP